MARRKVKSFFGALGDVVGANSNPALMRARELTYEAQRLASRGQCRKAISLARRAKTAAEQALKNARDYPGPAERAADKAGDVFYVVRSSCKTGKRLKNEAFELDGIFLGMPMSFILAAAVTSVGLGVAAKQWQKARAAKLIPTVAPVNTTLAPVNIPTQGAAAEIKMQQTLNQKIASTLFKPGVY